MSEQRFINTSAFDFGHISDTRRDITSLKFGVLTRAYGLEMVRNLNGLVADYFRGRAYFLSVILD